MSNQWVNTKSKNMMKLLANKLLFKSGIIHVPIGHFYSPIPDPEEIRLGEQTNFDVIPQKIPGIDLNETEQLDLLNKFQNFYQDLPFQEDKINGLRFFLDNPSFSYSDAIFLYCTIRHLRPQKIIEVGSGYSSCVILDTNELFFDDDISCTFIDPYPERLLSLIEDSDRDANEIIASKIQDIELSKFDELLPNDILFIDSTHVCKTGSDVNYIFSEILPSLKSGVYIHFHDIHYPFEYPQEWIRQNRAWNECYMLKTFLQYNKSFKIVCFNTYLEHFYGDWFKKEMPLCTKNTGGSIWLKKI